MYQFYIGNLPINGNAARPTVVVTVAGRQVQPLSRVSRKKIGLRLDAADEVAVQLRQRVNHEVVAKVTAVSAEDDRLEIVARAAVTQREALRPETLLGLLPTIRAVAHGVAVLLLRAETLEERNAQPCEQHPSTDKASAEHETSVRHRLDTAAQQGHGDNGREDKNLHVFSLPLVEKVLNTL